MRSLVVIAGVLMAVAAAGEAPVFVPIKIDGPTHDPENGTFWYGPFSEGSAVFDVNGDGVLDITCGANWYEGPRWTKHENYREHAYPVGEYVNNNGEYGADINGDGKTDLISAGWMANGVFWYENPGDGSTPWTATKILDSISTEGLVIEDLDGDGDFDIVVNHWGKEDGQGVTWLELKDGEFVAHVLGQDGDEHGMGVGDINGDGRTDIVTPEGWWEQPENASNGTWVFHADYRIPDGVEGSIRMPVIDVNGDGLNDIIVGHGHGYGLFWLEQRVDGEQRSFVTHTIDETIGQLHTCILADINQDGKPDLVTGKRLRGHAGNDPSAFDPLFMFWYDIDGGAFRRHVISYNHTFDYPEVEEDGPAPNCAIGTGMNINVQDMNGDGLVDIVVGGKSGLYLFVNRGNPPTKPMVVKD